MLNMFMYQLKEMMLMGMVRLIHYITVLNCLYLYYYDILFYLIDLIIFNYIHSLLITNLISL
jgi:hypothetical protein